MPPKPKLHKNSGKATIQRPPQVIQNQNSSEPSTSSLSPEVEQQFEVELCWCIQQLQIALKSGKLNQKQIQDHTKALNTLMSNSAPMVKKRQVMRLSFGDYRAKMSAEDKRSSRNVTNIKLTTANPSKKSMFVKKSVFSSGMGNNFRFNFDQPKEDIADNFSNVKIESDDYNNAAESKKIGNNYQFTPSNNSFRFNFNNTEEP